MSQHDDLSSFDEQIRRIHSIAGTRTQAELAQFLGIRQPSVSDAKKRGKIPAEWLLILMRSRNVNPEWILAGRKPRFITFFPDAYDDADAARECAEAIEAARHISSRILADELARRIALNETDKPGR